MALCAAQAVLCNAAGSKDEEIRNDDLLQLAPSASRSYNTRSTRYLASSQRIPL